MYLFLFLISTRRHVWGGGLDHLFLRQIGPIVDKQTVRRHLDRYEEEEYPDGSGPDLYRAMRDYPRTGSGDWWARFERWNLIVVSLWPRNCAKFEDRGKELRSTEFDNTFQTSGICGGGGVFLPACLYWRRSIVKAGATVGGIWRLTGREEDTCKKM
jgi:hypothetical protein